MEQAGKRVTRVGRWIVGVPFEAWRYATRPTRVFHSEVRVPSDEPLLEVTPLDAELARGVQVAADGAGPEFHRTYTVRLTECTARAREVIDGLRRDFGGASPSGMTDIDEPEGRRPFAVGDEVQVHLPGPWDAPVRVIDVAQDRFRFATIEGHMEAGEIEFHVRELDEPGELLCTIQSWARSGDLAFAALYHPLGLAKAVQGHMWVSFLERLAQRSGGKIEDGIRIVTRRREREA